MSKHTLKVYFKLGQWSAWPHILRVSRNFLLSLPSNDSNMSKQRDLISTTLLFIPVGAGT